MGWQCGVDGFSWHHRLPRWESIDRHLLAKETLQFLFVWR